MELSLLPCKEVGLFFRPSRFLDDLGLQFILICLIRMGPSSVDTQSSNRGERPLAVRTLVSGRIRWLGG